MLFQSLKEPSLPRGKNLPLSPNHSQDSYESTKRKKKTGSTSIVPLSRIKPINFAEFPVQTETVASRTSATLPRMSGRLSMTCTLSSCKRNKASLGHAVHLSRLDFCSIQFGGERRVVEEMVREGE